MVIHSGFFTPTSRCIYTYYGARIFSSFHGWKLKKSCFYWIRNQKFSRGLRPRTPLNSKIRFKITNISSKLLTKTWKTRFWKLSYFWHSSSGNTKKHKDTFSVHSDQFQRNRSKKLSIQDGIFYHFQKYTYYGDFLNLKKKNAEVLWDVPKLKFTLIHTHIPFFDKINFWHFSIFQLWVCEL